MEIDCGNTGISLRECGCTGGSNGTMRKRRKLVLASHLSSWKSQFRKEVLVGTVPRRTHKKETSILQQLVSQPETVQALQSHRTRTKFWLPHSKEEAQLNVSDDKFAKKWSPYHASLRLKLTWPHPKVIDAHMKLSHRTPSAHLLIIKHSQTPEYSKLKNILDNDGYLTV